jgi:hypothetical protein
MAFEWKAYAELARELEKQALEAVDKEAWYRTVISRAYYGAFCHARNYAHAKHKFHAKGEAEDHKRLTALLIIGKFMQVANRLKSLRQLRNMADHEDDPPLHWDFAAHSAIQEADKILQALVF